MMYPFLTLNDDTEIVHSEKKPDGRIKVYMEKPDSEDGFHYATCWIPEMKWENIYRFSEQEMKNLRSIVEDNKQKIIERAEKR